MAKNILIADDEVEIVELVELYLEKENYNIIKCFNGIDAWNIMCEKNIDLAIFDIMMPGIDGYQLIKKAREKLNIPIILISAKSDFSDKILGLGLGADDYVTKPFNPLELIARVQAQLRRYYLLKGDNDNGQKTERIVYGDIELDEESCEAFKGGKLLELTSTEYKILSLFIKNIDKVFTKKQIFETVWEEVYYGDDNTIMVHISNLRDKIEDNPKKPEYLKTVRGLGYKFTGKSKVD
ncbi:response regulator transcription factor [Clostridium folliculivorans]|uniref:Stage 0 sporulation protein A homolog n=1 Tax=Clostridium folliculivorans TaxID=2886038 RepID=A0A9W5Y5Z9_9CLOT|nr:response regulator transcription factor [Clostridium folliculivorans]GKU27113.1 DNA-binding response regulator [Clostridium folliculivorans]GKU31730.1 DNA-binding response regulator [Clostridium folliculivorans]